MTTLDRRLLLILEWFLVYRKRSSIRRTTFRAWSRLDRSSRASRTDRTWTIRSTKKRRRSSTSDLTALAIRIRAHISTWEDRWREGLRLRRCNWKKGRCSRPALHIAITAHRQRLVLRHPTLYTRSTGPVMTSCRLTQKWTSDSQHRLRIPPTPAPPSYLLRSMQNM